MLKIPIQEEKRRDSNRQYGDLEHLGKYYSDYELLDEYATLIDQRNTLEIFFLELIGELVTIDIKDADDADTEQNATNKLFRPSSPAPAFEDNSIIIDIREEAPQLKHRKAARDY